MASITGYLSERFTLTVNQGKSAVDRPWKRTFLSYSMTRHRNHGLPLPRKRLPGSRPTSRRPLGGEGGRTSKPPLERQYRNLGVG